MGLVFFFSHSSSKKNNNIKVICWALSSKDSEIKKCSTPKIQWNQILLLLSLSWEAHTLRTRANTQDRKSDVNRRLTKWASQGDMNRAFIPPCVFMYLYGIILQTLKKKNPEMYTCYIQYNRCTSSAHVLWERLAIIVALCIPLVSSTILFRIETGRTTSCSCMI